MARNNFIAHTGGAVAVTVAAKTLLAIKAPANIGVAVKSVTVTADSNNAGQQAMLVELVRYSGAAGGQSDGTAGSAGVATRKHTGLNTIQTAVNKNYSAEPTVAEVLESWHVNPAAGMQYPFPINEEPIARNGELMGVRITSNSGITPNVAIALECEE